MELIVAWLALIVSVATGAWSLRSIREQVRIARLANKNTFVSRMDATIASIDAARVRTAP